MRVPFLDLKRQYESIKQEIDDAIQRVLDSQQFILGQEVEEFERRMAKYCGVKHAIGVASGTDALLLSLKASGISSGVITTPFTFFATAGAIHNAGATPVFADIEPGTYNIDVEGVKKVLDSKSNKMIRAIIPVHLFGQAAEMNAIMKIAEEYDLVVIEDTAQAIGEEYYGKKASSIGTLGCFSFFPSKNLGGYGDGGLVTTNDDELADKIRTLRMHGAKPKYYHHVIGYNSRLDTIQAAILSVVSTDMLPQVLYNKHFRCNSKWEGKIWIFRTIGTFSRITFHQKNLQSSAGDSWRSGVLVDTQKSK